MTTQLSLGMRRLIGWIAAIGAVLVLAGKLMGADWLRLVLGMFGANT